jgi:putative FmdB family regulatory protein
MPRYEYECDACGIRFERIQHFRDEPLKDCPECGFSVHRVLQPVGIIFKGSGFYVTDHNKVSSASAPPPKELQAPKGSEEKKALPAPKASPADNKTEKTETAD